MDFLNGKNRLAELDTIIISGHGQNRKLHFPPLDESIYETHEIRGDFGPEEFKNLSQLKEQLVLCTGCDLAYPAMAQVFLAAGAKGYIGIEGYIEANAVLLFRTRFFYALKSRPGSISVAFKQANQQDQETQIFR